MYWTDSGADKIQRANLDGGSVEDLVTTGLFAPVGIALGATPPGAVLWGDDDCNGAVAAVDALKNLQEVAGLPYSQTDPCFGLGESVDIQLASATERIWGDVDCDGDLDSVDALAILRKIAAFSVNQQPNCPEIGSSVLVADLTSG